MWFRDLVRQKQEAERRLVEIEAERKSARKRLLEIKKDLSDEFDPSD